jgi:hypothetical protein
LNVRWIGVSRRTPSAPSSELVHEGDKGVGGYAPKTADQDRLDSAGGDKCIHDGSADPETLGGLLNRQH